MYGNEQAFNAWIESLAKQFGQDAADNFAADVRCKLHKMQRRHQQDIRDMEAARLLPLGAEVAVERIGCHRSTLYRRASRGNKVARQTPDATAA